MELQNLIPMESGATKRSLDSDSSADASTKSSDDSTTFDEQLQAMLLTVRDPGFPPPVVPEATPLDDISLHVDSPTESADSLTTIGLNRPTSASAATNVTSDNDGLQSALKSEFTQQAGTTAPDETEMTAVLPKQRLSDGETETETETEIEIVAPEDSQLTAFERSESATNSRRDQQLPGHQADTNSVNVLEHESGDLLSTTDESQRRQFDQGDDSAKHTQFQPTDVERLDNAPLDIAPETSASVRATASPQIRQPIATPPGISDQIAAEAVRHAEVVKQTGQQTFTMRLDPPHLGKLTIEMKKTTKGISLRVHAVEAETREMIRASASELRSDLTQQDSIFQELDIDVRTGDGAGQSSEEESRQQHQQRTIIDDTPKIAAPSNNISFVA